jgi:hypothetical protein
VGFDDDPLPNVTGADGYELNIQRVVDLFKSDHSDLIEFMSSIEHLIIDEAQDVVGKRAELMIAMLRSLSPNCGVTILADPAQAIYGFTTDDEEDESATRSMLDLLETECPRELITKRLAQIYRTDSPRLVAVFKKTRDTLESSEDIQNHLATVQDTIRAESGNDIGTTSYEGLVELLRKESYQTSLVLFRRRAEALLASSYCSSSGLDHRLRMSGLPTIVSPWIGWLFSEIESPIVSRGIFENLWAKQSSRAAALFEGLSQSDCWGVLHRVAAAKSSDAVDLVQLRRLLARSRPPVELTVPECGERGPILGTIHASKGREENCVVLVIPARQSWHADSGSREQVLEEGRVYYVGATRARQILAVASNANVTVSYLDSRRVYRLLPGNRVQLEVGRDLDLDRISHLAWSSAAEVQEALAISAGKSVEVRAICMPEMKYSWRIELGLRKSEHLVKDIEIAEMSRRFNDDIGTIWRIVDVEGNLRPPNYIQHLYLTGTTTIGLTDAEMEAVRAPYSHSGLALSPVIKGFPTIPFLFRKGGNAR